jgi:hypothetical protein
LRRGPVLVDATETAAQTHALLRARAGFDINQIAAEYHALRASVLRLWMDDGQPEAPHMDDVIRFNEAIDQALAESVALFPCAGRNLLLGMLGHDMRNPFQAIQVTASYLESLTGRLQRRNAFSSTGNSLSAQRSNDRPRSHVRPSCSSLTLR